MGTLPTIAPETAAGRPGSADDAPLMPPPGVAALDAAALDAFVREHHHRLVRLARLVCIDASEAADAVQGALEQSWRRRDALRDAASLKPWLDRIVVREAIRLDRRRRSPLARLLARATAIPMDLADARSSPDANIVALRAAFADLPANQRAAIALHLHLGYTIAETADLVDAKPETVRSRLRVGRERLRAALEDRPR